MIILLIAIEGDHWKLERERGDERRVKMIGRQWNISPVASLK